MWGDLSVKQRSYGSGKIFTNVELKEVFDDLGIIPDCLFEDDSPALYTHRTVDGNEIYFISNQSDKAIVTLPKFRVKGKVPELWDAVTGSTRSLPSFIENEEFTQVPLKLDAYQSCFMVFRRHGKPLSTELEANFLSLRLL